MLISIYRTLIMMTADLHLNSIRLLRNHCNSLLKKNKMFKLRMTKATLINSLKNKEFNSQSEFVQPHPKVRELKSLIAFSNWQKCRSKDQYKQRKVQLKSHTIVVLLNHLKKEAEKMMKMLLQRKVTLVQPKKMNAKKRMSLLAKAKE